MPYPRSRLLALAGLGLLAGCATGSYSINMPISGGQTVPLELTTTGMLHGENDDFRIDAAVYQFDPKVKNGTYLFAFLVKKRGAPRSVKVDDVTDDEPKNLYQTDQIKVQDGHWKQRTESFVPDQQNLKWIFEIENSIRVYRFTIVTADGRTDVLYEGCNYMGFVKELIRKSLAENAAAAPPAATP